MKNNILTRSTFTLGLLAFASTAFAGDRPAFSGFYGNLSAGVLQTAAKINLTADLSFTTEFAIAQQERVWQNEGLGALALGYSDFFYGRFRLGGEIFVNVSNSRSTLDHSYQIAGDGSEFVLLSDANARLHHWEYGVDLLPAALVDPCNLVYGRVGIGINRVHLEQNTLFTDASDPDALLYSPLYLTEENHRLGLRLGLGVEHGICPRFAITADYIFTYYGSLSTKGAADLNTNVAGLIPSGLIGVVDASYRTQALMAGVKYYFK